MPDHGALGDGSLIAKERAFLRELQGRSLELKREGKSADEAAAIVTTEFKTKYADWQTMGPVANVVKRVYAENRDLEVEPDGPAHRSRSHIVRSAEGRKKIVQRVFVRQVHHRQARAPLVFFAVEEVVVAHGKIEQIARCDARRIVVVVLCAGGGYF